MNGNDKAPSSSNPLPVVMGVGIGGGDPVGAKGIGGVGEGLGGGLGGSSLPSGVGGGVSGGSGGVSGGGGSLDVSGGGGRGGGGVGALPSPCIGDLDGLVLKSGDEFLLRCESLESTGLLSGNPLPI